MTKWSMRVLPCRGGPDPRDVWCAWCFLGLGHLGNNGHGMTAGRPSIRPHPAIEAVNPIARGNWSIMAACLLLLLLMLLLCSVVIIAASARKNKNTSLPLPVPDGLDPCDDRRIHIRCNRTDQIIRAQVQKQAPKRSNFQTWDHIIPVVNRNHEGFQTNLLTTKITSFNIQHHTLHFASSSEISLHTRSRKLLQTKFIKVAKVNAHQLFNYCQSCWSTTRKSIRKVHKRWSRPSDLVFVTRRVETIFAEALVEHIICKRRE
jgi:hypothetical protein